MRKLRSQEEIMATWQGDPDKPVVSICCITYNHEPYIEDALEGFLIQQTDFPFEILIHDDASTDATAEIIREYARVYPKLIKPIYQTVNQYSRVRAMNPTFNYPRAKGDYIALCEGDDYWTCPDKLKKQVAVLSKDQSISLIFHPSEIKRYSSIKKNMTTTIHPLGRWDENILFYEGGSSAPTASLLFRTEHIKSLPEWLYEAPVGDMPLKLLLASRGGIYFIHDVMSVRRLGVPGSWNSRVRGNKQHETKYLQGMLKMLSQFNHYSGGVWKFDVEKIQCRYAAKINWLGVENWIDVQSKYPEGFKRLGWKPKLWFYLARYLSGRACD